MGQSGPQGPWMPGEDGGVSHASPTLGRRYEVQSWVITRVQLLGLPGGHPAAQQTPCVGGTLAQLADARDAASPTSFPLLLGLQPLTGKELSALSVTFRFREAESLRGHPSWKRPLLLQSELQSKPGFSLPPPQLPGSGAEGVGGKTAHGCPWDRQW